MNELSNWDSAEFYRGYQTALSEIHHPDTCRCQFKVTSKNTGAQGKVFAIREINNETFFLICQYGKWEWKNANEFNPLQ